MAQHDVRQGYQCRQLGNTCESGQVHRLRPTSVGNAFAKRFLVRTAKQDTPHAVDAMKLIDRLSEALPRPDLCLAAGTRGDGHNTLVLRDAGFAEQVPCLGSCRLIMCEPEFHRDIIKPEHPGYPVVAIDGMNVRVLDDDAVIVEDPRSFAGVAEADPNRCPSRPSYPTRSEESLQVEDQVVAPASKTADKSDKLARDPRTSADQAKPLAIERNQLVQLVVSIEKRGER